MKKFLTILAAAALLLPACKRGIFTENYRTTVSYPLEEGLEKPSLTVDISVDYPVGGLQDSVLTKMTSNILISVLELESEPSDVKSTVDGFVEDLQENFRDENLEFWKTDKEKLTEDQINDFYCWEYFVNCYFGERWKDYVSYENEFYTYSGGAHGMQGLIPVVFSTVTGDIVTEADIFSEGYEEPLVESLRKHLEDAFVDNAEDFECVFNKEIEPNGCFEVGKAGITYYYQPYEIAPYYIGVISVTVPWSELKGYIR